jgi:hypothetical protein
MDRREQTMKSVVRTLVHGAIVSAVFVVATSLSPPSVALADDNKLLGVWKLKSFIIESVQTKERRPVYGDNPKGYLIVTPERFTAIITGEGRRPPQNDEDRLLSFRTMFAYSGPYRIEGNRLTTQVEVAWNEAWTGTDQTRIFRLEGDKLFIEGLGAPSVNNASMGVTVGKLEWERSK